MSFISGIFTKNLTTNPPLLITDSTMPIKAIRQSPELPFTDYKLTQEQIKQAITTRGLADLLAQQGYTDAPRKLEQQIRVEEKSVEGETAHSRVKRVVAGTKQCKYPMPLVVLKFEKMEGQKNTCGGTIVGKKEVLTAAHCLIGVPKKSIRVCHGELKREKFIGMDKKEPPVRCYKAGEIYIYPEYNSTSHENDIALLKIKKPYFHKTNCKMPLLSDKQHETLKNESIEWGWLFNMPTTPNMVVMGWGSTEEGKPSETLLAAKLHNVNKGVFPTGVDNKTVDCSASTVICAGDMHTFQTSLNFNNHPISQNACKGDSGGPLFYTHNKTASLAGIVSTGPNRCGHKAPAVYTDVYHFKDWIKNKTRSNEHFPSCDKVELLGEEYEVNDKESQ